MGQLAGGSSDGLTPGVLGTGTNGSGGVVGVTDTGIGVDGSSTGKGVGVRGVSASADGVQGTNGVASAISTPAFGCGVRGESTNGYGVYGASENASGVYGTSGPGHLAGEFAGDVGIGGNLTSIGLTATTATVAANLSVLGTFSAVGASLAEIVVTGNVTANDFSLSGHDCAEDFDIADARQIEPGTVVVFDGEGAISQSEEPYNKRVAGVISGAGKYRPGVVLGRDGSPREGKAPVALMGRVCCKVDATYSPIEVGDMLTTSPTSGFAMKASDPSKAFGAVIGKALAPHTDGRGLIPILVTLQ